jgi:hypothetical protein
MRVIVCWLGPLLTALLQLAGMHDYKIDGMVKRSFTNTHKKSAKALPFDTNEVGY